MEAKPRKTSAENFIKDIRRKPPPRIFSLEQKILIVMEALRGEDSVAAIWSRHGTQRIIVLQMEQGVSAGR